MTSIFRAGWNCDECCLFLWPSNENQMKIAERFCDPSMETEFHHPDSTANAPRFTPRKRKGQGVVTTSALPTALGWGPFTRSKMTFQLFKTSAAIRI